MPSLPAHLYLATRDVDTERDGAPVVPEAWWDDRAQRVGPWWTWRHPSSGDVVAAARVNAVGGRGLYAVAGPRSWLESLASGTDEVMPAREAWRRRAETMPRTICRAWRWWRCDVTERATQDDVDAGLAAAVGDAIQRDGVVRRLSSAGTLLPDPTVTALPWDLDAEGVPTTIGAAVIRVRALVRPALPPSLPTIAGVSLHDILEAEADRGA